MLFHIRKDVGTVHCGLAIEVVYDMHKEHCTSEAAITSNYPFRYYVGDAVCIDCVRKCRLGRFKACRDVTAGVWVVLCECGGVRPHGAPCGAGGKPNGRWFR